VQERGKVINVVWQEQQGNEKKEDKQSILV
jgi:hypothetical protein